MQQTPDTTSTSPRAGSADLARARRVAVAVILLMLACGLNIAVNDSFAHGAGLDTFIAGTTNPWQLFINLDLISGLVLMLAWLVWRERGSPLPEIVAWSLLILWWGNIAVACYILKCLFQAQGNPEAFFMGRHAAGARLRSMRSLGAWPAWLGATGAMVVAAFMIRGLVSVGLAGVSAAGYFAACGTVIFALLVFALSGGREAAR